MHPAPAFPMQFTGPVRMENDMKKDESQAARITGGLRFILFIFGC